MERLPPEIGLKKASHYITFSNAGRLLVGLGVALTLPFAADYLSDYQKKERIAALPTLTAVEVFGTPKPRLTEVIQSPTPLVVAAETPTVIPTSTPRLIEALRRLDIPALELDSEVVESRFIDGMWQVPKFVVGHLEGTARAGEDGNTVLVGHSTSISSGEIFADIDRLKPGDLIVVGSDTRTFSYRVREVGVVSWDDLSVVKPTPNRRTLTMLTCTGEWLSGQVDYDSRVVVRAELE